MINSDKQHENLDERAVNSFGINKRLELLNRLSVLILSLMLLIKVKGFFLIGRSNDKWNLHHINLLANKVSRFSILKLKCQKGLGT